MKRIPILLFVGLVIFATAARAQAPGAVQNPGVPQLVQFSGTLKDVGARPVTGSASVTFAIYAEQDGGTPLWSETQNVAADANGHYEATLGIATSGGLPQEIFGTGQSRWLGVRIAGRAELPRVLLVSVPYALRAADAEMLGGLPASAFVTTQSLAASKTASGEAVIATGAPQLGASGVTPDAAPTGGGTAGYLPLWTSAANLGDSVLFQTSAGNVGIGTTTPASTLDVTGNSTFHGSFQVAPGNTATASSGFSSHSMQFQASLYNSTAKAPNTLAFGFLALPLGNNSASPSAKLDVYFGDPFGGTFADTGLSIASGGIITFVKGQTFPGTGSITDVSAGTGLVGGGTTGTVTVNVDPTKVPLLGNANTFNATQTINGDLNLPATTGANVGVLNIGGVPFLHGYTAANQNVFVGDAGNFKTTGGFNTGVGVGALAANTSGYENTAIGNVAMTSNTTGGNNVALGYDTLLNNNTGGGNTAGGNQALLYSVSGTLNTGFGYGAVRSNSTGNFNTGVGGNAGNIPDGSSGTGSYNTAVGAYASASTGILSNTTAVGANAIVGQNNSLVLGNTTSAPGAQFVNVGIGTETPRSTIEATVSAPGALGPVLTLTNSGSGSSTATSLDFNTYLPSSTGPYNPAARIVAADDGNSDFGTNLEFYLNGYGQPNNGLQQIMSIAYYGVNVSGTLSGQGGGNAAPGVIGDGGLAGSGGDGGDGGNFLGGSGENGSKGGDGIYSSAGAFSVGADYAGNFSGNVTVAGTLSSTNTEFKIDLPLDPANKYLVHASVESSEMMNIYTGNAVTDESGLATVALPNWFESLNTDFRYQLTTIGQDAHAWISQKVSGGKFSVRTNAPNVEVSWQITAVRQDAYAKAHPMVAEQEKPLNERGYYIHPELYGQPEQRQTEWGRRPERMRQMEAMRERAKQVRSPQTSASSGKTTAATPASAVNRSFAHPVAAAQNPGVATRPVLIAKPATTAKP